MVRLIRKDEVARWSETMNRFHYLGYHSIGGQSLRYVATAAGEWVALLGWGSAALKCTVRERFIGWDEQTKLKRLVLISNNVRFLVLPWVRCKNLASRVLRYCQVLWMRKSASPVESSCRFFQFSVHEPPPLHYQGDLLITH